jgi:hypothetical protein
VAEPAENTYVVTVVLRDTRKRDALEFADDIGHHARAACSGEFDIFTAHLKDES